jgi:hypothetical protein
MQSAVGIIDALPCVFGRMSESWGGQFKVDADG